MLSIVSGVGYMEKILLEEMPELELHVNEPSTVGMKWLREYIPNERIYIGLPPACLPSDVQYDMIYLSTVDYGIPTREFQHLLWELRAQLAPGGELVQLCERHQDWHSGRVAPCGHSPPAVLGVAAHAG